MPDPGHGRILFAGEMDELFRSAQHGGIPSCTGRSDHGMSGRYATIDQLKNVVASDDTRPYLLNEFAHAMGNAMGDLGQASLPHGT